jgi:accessory gene regulator protein AgrB
LVAAPPAQHDHHHVIVETKHEKNIRKRNGCHGCFMMFIVVVVRTSITIMAVVLVVAFVSLPPSFSKVPRDAHAPNGIGHRHNGGKQLHNAIQ